MGEDVVDFLVRTLFDNGEAFLAQLFGATDVLAAIQIHIYLRVLPDSPPPAVEPGYDNIQVGMNRKEIMTGIVGVAIGFILGFFISQYAQQPAGLPVSQTASSELPQDHPTPEEMEHLQHLLQQVEADPQDRQSRILLGNAYYDMGRYDAAVRWYEEALALDSDDVNVTTDLATSYLYMNNVDKAIETYKQSLNLNPDHPQTLQNLGIAYFYTGRYRDAIQHWERLVENNPEYPHVEEIKKQIEAARAHLSQDSSSG